jgi:peptidoglycan hydrolase FlgJ
VPISAPSQIGLDILRSPALPGIEPARAERLSRSSAAAGQFEVDETGDAKAAGTADKPDTPASFKRFEAMVLQTFIQNMLPKDSASVYGKGMAGDMWKSLLAEKVAEVMADRGGIGIADRVLGERYAAQTEAKPAPQTQAKPAMQAAETSIASQADPRTPIAPAVVEGMQRSLSQLLTDDPAASPDAEVQSTTKRG